MNGHSGNREAFAAKLDNSGTLIWNIFLGSGHSDYGYGIAADLSGNVYVTGESMNEWGNPIYPKRTGLQDAFAAKLDTYGNLIWNTFMGTTNIDYGGKGIAVDVYGDVYVTGQSNFNWTDGTWGPPISTNPTRPPGPVEPSGCPGCWRASVAKLNNSGYLHWYTFLEWEGQGITVDNSGWVYVTGNGGNYDAFVAKFDSSNGIREWTSYNGRLYRNDFGYGIAVDGTGNIYATGDAGKPFV